MFCLGHMPEHHVPTKRHKKHHMRVAGGWELPACMATYVCGVAAGQAWGSMVGHAGGVNAGCLWGHPTCAVCRGGGTASVPGGLVLPGKKHRPAQSAEGHRVNTTERLQGTNACRLFASPIGG
jgi:hypothetical protein